MQIYNLYLMVVVGLSRYVLLVGYVTQASCKYEEVACDVSVLIKQVDIIVVWLTKSYNLCLRYVAKTVIYIHTEVNFAIYTSNNELTDTGSNLRR